MIRTIKSAFKAARFQEQSFATAIAWAIDDLRMEFDQVLFDAGVPPLLLIDVQGLPDCLGRAEYVLKTQWHELRNLQDIASMLREMNREAVMGTDFE
jgi:hypothetical protein